MMNILDVKVERVERKPKFEYILGNINPSHVLYIYHFFAFSFLSGALVALLQHTSPALKQQYRYFMRQPLGPPLLELNISL